MATQPESPSNSLSQLAQNVFSDSNSSIMLAAILSLLLVILFVLLLHVYAKWFLSQSQLRSHTRRWRTPVTVSGVLEPSHFHSINIEATPTCTKGLDSATVSAIPTFEHKAEKTEELECVVCLSVIEEGEIGRRLPKCGHAFHVECIDMWFTSHCNCPICRAPILVSDDSPSASDDVFEIVVVTPGYEISESEIGAMSDSVSENSSSLLGFSLKRLLSKVFQSPDHVTELDASHWNMNSSQSLHSFCSLEIGWFSFGHVPSFFLCLFLSIGPEI